MPYKGGVQLLPESERRPTLSTYTSGNGLFYSAIVIGVLILVASATISNYKKNLTDKIDLVTQQIKLTEKGRNRDQEKVLIIASQQSKILKNLLESKLFWTQAFAAIERLTIDSVTLTSIDAKLDKNNIEFYATADNWKSVSLQLASLVTESGFARFNPGKIETLTTGGIKFGGEIIIDRNKLLIKNKSSPSPIP